MKKLLLVGLLLLVPQLASARMYMCVDPATGQTSFTDRACETPGAREEIRVNRTNLESGGQSGKQGRKKTWRSQEDRRKSGMEYAAERRKLYENSATAANN